jgi:hypothetical protein
MAFVNSAWASPIGPNWDAQDWSCAYDVWVNILHWLWGVENKQIVEGLARNSPTLQTLVDRFQDMQNEEPGLELTEVQDRCRQSLWSLHPGEYPHGQIGADIQTLTQDLMGLRGDTDVAVTQCVACHVYQEQQGLEVRALNGYTVLQDCNSTQEEVNIRHQPVGACRTCQQMVVIMHEILDVICFDVMDKPLAVLDPVLVLPVQGKYCLAGIIYFGQYHFVSRVITSVGMVYSYDGIESSSSTYEGELGSTLSANGLKQLKGKIPSVVLYVRDVLA